MIFRKPTTIFESPFTAHLLYMR